MRLLDAFRAFDYNRDGVLSCSELYGGLEWLGMKLAPQDIYAVVRHIDTYKDGRIRYLDWEAALKDPMLEEEDENNTGKSAEFGNLEIMPKQIEELYVDRADIISRQEEIHDSALREIKVKVKDVSSWRQIWSSEGTGARVHVTVWTPHISQHTMFRRNKYRVNLGHYAVVMGQGHHISLRGALHISKSAKAPSSLKGLTVELTDMDVSTLKKSSNLDEVHVNYLMPHPVGFKMAWWQQSTSETGNLYVWRPIPPSDDFVALGFVATTTNQDPALDSVRCVNKGFLVASSMKPTKIWDNAGTGGKKGSFWVVNNLGLVAVTEGHDPPSPCYELKSSRFIAFDAFTLSGSSSNQDDAPAVPQRPPKQLPAKPPTPTNTPLPTVNLLPITPAPNLVVTPLSTPSVPPPQQLQPQQLQPQQLQPQQLQPPRRPKANTISTYDSLPRPPPTQPPIVSPRPPVTPPPSKPPPPVFPTNPPTPTKSLPLQPPLIPTVVSRAPPTTTPTPTPAVTTTLGVTPMKKSASFIAPSSSNTAPSTLTKTPSSVAPSKPPSVAPLAKIPSATTLKAVPSPFVQAQAQQSQQAPAARPTITPPFAPIRQLPAKPPPK